ncbi:hypothetical protein EVAR_17071_1 [Eumeta japonica]|uniref:Uncharacterized protein n=1 Tax=Eumeta variegata TaxID=151549 RepID=A0A4C1V4K1_EUMVA|nr:hypothetical protein EVAR_17071_1 [Eumeta japonica]
MTSKRCCIPRRRAPAMSGNTFLREKFTSAARCSARASDKVVPPSTRPRSERDGKIFWGISFRARRCADAIAAAARAPVLRDSSSTACFASYRRLFRRCLIASGTYVSSLSIRLSACIVVFSSVLRVLDRRHSAITPERPRAHLPTSASRAQLPDAELAVGRRPLLIDELYRCTIWMCTCTYYSKIRH